MSSTQAAETITSLATLRAIKEIEQPDIRKQALAYMLLAHQKGYPTPPLSGFKLDGVDLRGWVFEGTWDAPLRLNHVSFQHARLEGVRFRHVQLDHADFFQVQLDRVKLHNAHAHFVRFAQAQLVDTIFREANLASSDFNDAVNAHESFRDINTMLQAVLTLQMAVEWCLVHMTIQSGFGMPRLVNVYTFFRDMEALF